MTNTPNTLRQVFVFHFEQQIKRELKGIHICGCRFNERPNAKTDGSKSLSYTGLSGELEHLSDVRYKEE